MEGRGGRGGIGAAINIQDIGIVHRVFARLCFSDRGEIVKRERDRGEAVMCVFIFVEAI